MKRHIDLITEIQSDDWWQDVSLPTLEKVRRRLRNLVHLIDRNHKKVVYTDFEDIIGDGTEIRSPGAGDFTLFKQKARSFLQDHSDLPVVYKLRMNIQIDNADIEQLNGALEEIGDGKLIERASTESKGLGLFARSMVGLDSKASAAALSEFITGTTLTAQQITFIELISAHLVEHGLVERKHFYDPPFTDIAPAGPSGIFGKADLQQLLNTLDRVRTTATPK